MNKSNNISWITKNPKKTGFIIFFVTLFLILLLFDQTISYIQPIEIDKKSGIIRAISLRENHPESNRVIRPEDPILQNSDNLIDQDYPFRTDCNGFLLPNNNHVNPDHKIIFMGGSTTECVYVKENNRFPYLVGQLIEEKTNKLINSYNSGKSGNSAVHSLDVLLNKIIPMEPDMVVIMHAINDYALLTYDHTYWPIGTTRSTIITIKDYLPKVKNETFIWHLKGLFRSIYPNIYYKIFLVKGRIIRPPKPKEPVDEWADRRHMVKDRDFNFMQKEFKWILQTLVTVSKTREILPVLMTQANRFKDNPDGFILKSMNPLLSGGITYETFKKEYDTFNEIIREVAKANDIPLIDLAKLVPQKKEYMYDSIHFNDTGSKFVANIVSEKLIDFISKY